MRSKPSGIKAIFVGCCFVVLPQFVHAADSTSLEVQRDSSSSKPSIASEKPLQDTIKVIHDTIIVKKCDYSTNSKFCKTKKTTTPQRPKGKELLTVRKNHIGLSVASSLVRNEKIDDWYAISRWGFSYHRAVTKYVAIGFSKLSFYSIESIMGRRSAAGIAPSVQASTFLGSKWQVGAEGSVYIQGHFNNNDFDDNYDVTASASLNTELFSQFWIGTHFSLGPVVSFNGVFAGNEFASSSNNGPSVIPRYGVWSEFGIKFAAHF